MKTTKEKSQKKSAKKAAKKQLEQTLSERFLATIRELGHNAEAIGEEVAKASKLVARKLSKRLADVKEVVEQKIEEVKAKPAVVRTVKKATTATGKPGRKTKQASAKAPVAQSVKVTAIETADKARTLIEKPVVKSKTRMPEMLTEPPVETPKKAPAARKPAKPRAAKATKAATPQNTSAAEVAAAPKKRGRKPVSASTTTTTTSEPKRRGRKPASQQ